MEAKRVLIFDFNPDTSRQMRDVLYRLGYEPVIGDFRSMISDTIAYQPSLVIVDEWVRTLRGIENFALFSLNWHTCHIPVLTLTNDRNTDSFIDTRKNCGTISRPFRSRYFQRAVLSLAASANL